MQSGGRPRQQLCKLPASFDFPDHPLGTTITVLLPYHQKQIQEIIGVCAFRCHHIAQ